MPCYYIYFLFSFCYHDNNLNPLPAIYSYMEEKVQLWNKMCLEMTRKSIMLHGVSMLQWTGLTALLWRKDLKRWHRSCCTAQNSQHMAAYQRNLHPSDSYMTKVGYWKQHNDNQAWLFIIVGAKCMVLILHKIMNLFF